MTDVLWRTLGKGANYPDSHRGPSRPDEAL